MYESHGLAGYRERAVDGMLDSFGIYVRAPRDSLERSPSGLHVITATRVESLLTSTGARN